MPKQEVWVHVSLTFVAAAWIAYFLRGAHPSAPGLIIFLLLSVLGVNFTAWLGLRTRRGMQRNQRNSGIDVAPRSGPNP